MTMARILAPVPEKFSIEQSLIGDTKIPTFTATINIRPFIYNPELLSYLKKFEKEPVNGVHLSATSNEGLNKIRLAFSLQTTDETALQLSDKEFRQAIAEIKKHDLTSADSEKIISRYVVFLKANRVTSTYTPRVSRSANYGSSRMNF